MNWQPLIRNRFTLTFGIIAVVILVWNIYVASNNGGRLEGRVVDADGAPVADAIVVLARKTVASVETIAETETDADGRYHFDRHGQYFLVLTARSAAGESERRMIPLWFRNQNIDVPPLVLMP